MKLPIRLGTGLCRLSSQMDLERILYTGNRPREKKRKKSARKSANDLAACCVPDRPEALVQMQHPSLLIMTLYRGRANRVRHLPCIGVVVRMETKQGSTARTYDCPADGGLRRLANACKRDATSSAQKTDLAPRMLSKVLSPCCLEP